MPGSGTLRGPPAGDAGGLDPDRARAWAVLRAVDSWLWGLAAGFTLDPVRCARIVAELP